MEKKVPVITVDGPSGSGKGTISQRLASRLSWHFLDSGALYRVLALASKLHAVAFDNEPVLKVLAAHLDVQCVAKEIGSVPKIILEGNDVTDEIRTEEISKSSSIVSAFPAVREALLERQRAFREPPGLVTDGRDMGTVVFRDAQVKIFLSASTEERAKRRYFQLKQMGIDGSLDRIREELIERDLRDKGRAVAPLKPAEDAVIIDTTGLSIEQVLQRVMDEVVKVFPMLEI